MDAYEALVSRSSALELGDPGPDETAEQKIVAAALRAPDHGRLRPWRFISIQGAGRESFGEILAASLRRRDPNAPADVLGRERQKALRAPLILVGAANIVENPKIPAIEQLLSTAAAVQNIMLASQALGYGAMWKTGEAAYDDQVKEALGLKPTDQIVGFVYIGTPKTMPKAPPPIEPTAFLTRWPAD
jgi:nitroreductase